MRTKLVKEMQSGKGLIKVASIEQDPDLYNEAPIMAEAFKPQTLEKEAPVQVSFDSLRLEPKNEPF